MLISSDCHTAPRPAGDARQQLRPLACRRSRRRGPRSCSALQRRTAGRSKPPGSAGGEAPALLPVSVSPPSQNSFTIMLYNMRSVNSKEKQAELYTHLDNFVPDVLAMTETWLDESTSKLSIPNYDLVSRRDRPGCVAGELNHGGIAVYRRRGGISLTHLEDSELAERSWQSIHTNVGHLLLGLWYRPPGSPRSTCGRAA